jgi:hypothetical protein
VIVIGLVACRFEHGHTTGDDQNTGDASGSQATDASGQQADSKVPGVVPACWTASGYAAAPSGRKYRAPHSDATWMGAQIACAGAEAHLVVINDVTENAHVQTIMDQDSWIGLSDQAFDGTFAWVNGESLGYTSWASSEPMNGAGPTCVFTRKSDGKWRTSLCGMLEYVCECPYP